MMIFALFMTLCCCIIINIDYYFMYWIGGQHPPFLSGAYWSILEISHTQYSALFLKFCIDLYGKQNNLKSNITTHSEYVLRRIQAKLCVITMMMMMMNDDWTIYKLQWRTLPPIYNGCCGSIVYWVQGRLLF